MGSKHTTQFIERFLSTLKGGEPGGPGNPEDDDLDDAKEDDEDPTESAQVFTGKVRTYNSGKGFGFVECDEARDIYKNDIFLHRREAEAPEVLSSIGKPIAQGDIIDFTVRL